MVDNSDDFSMSRNIFRKGLTDVEVPIAFPLPGKRDVFQGNAIVAKIVEIDLQDWIDAPKLIRGILWHRDFLYVLTAEDSTLSIDSRNLVFLIIIIQM